MLGETLRRKRKALDMTLAQVGAQFQPKPIDASAVAKWETNQTVPGLHSLRQLARIYGTTLDDLAADSDGGTGTTQAVV